MRPFPGIQLTTARLLLRPLTVDDAPDLLHIHSDVEFMRYWTSEPWTSLDEARATIAREQAELAAGTHLALGIFLRDGQQLIGTCSLYNFDTQCRRAEIGYGIAREHWRRGYMLEGVSAVIELAFTELGLHRLEADIDPMNVASAASLEKLGFRREGHLRERWFVGDRVSDSVIYGLLAKEWPPSRVDEPGQEERAVSITLHHGWPEPASQRIMDGLAAFNAEHSPVTEEQKLAVVASCDGEVVAGLLGRTHHGWLYVGWLWVSDALRHRNLGTQLMTRAEDEARRRGCHHAHLTTLEFQAREFYERLGYEVFAVLESYPHPHQRFLMRKRLGDVISS